MHSSSGGIHSFNRNYMLSGHRFSVGGANNYRLIVIQISDQYMCVGERVRHCQAVKQANCRLNEPWTHGMISNSSVNPW
jgi:hypothetical protein